MTGMSMAETRPTPPAGYLLGEALQRFPGDKMFWSYTAPIALVLAAVAALLPRHQTAAAAFALCFALDLWLKQMLMPDWKERVAAKLYSTRSFSWAFVGFCLLYGLGLIVLPIALSFAIGLGLKSSTDLGGMLVLIVFQSITMVMLAMIFGSSLLFLPARVVRLPWNVGDAVRSAAGARGTLIAVALTCSAISIGGTVLGCVAMIGWVVGKLPEGPWVTFVGRAIIVFADMLALYVAAYCLSRLFVILTGWTPPPLPGNRIEPSLTA